MHTHSRMVVSAHADALSTSTYDYVTAGRIGVKKAVVDGAVLFSVASRPETLQSDVTHGSPQTLCMFYSAIASITLNPAPNAEAFYATVVRLLFIQPSVYHGLPRSGASLYYSS